MKDKFRFHLLGLVHLPCSKQYLSCAFTQKNHKMARMLLSLNHEVIYYGVDGSDVPCSEFVQTHTLDDIRADYGEGDDQFEIGYNWTRGDFKHDFNTARKPSTLKYYSACIREINARKKPDDFLLCTQGAYQTPIVDAVKLFLTCESGVGYRGSVPGRFRAFESSYIQNFTYGSEHPRECMDGSHYDRVIPNFFDPDDIEYSEQKGDYYLFIGRMIKRKGIVIADDVCRHLGKRLVIVGQAAEVDSRGYLVPITASPDFELPPGTWDYRGYADLPMRKDLMAHAIATFTPTEYLECFAGTHIESMLSGTPVLTTDYGVYPGTVVNGVNGYRCHTLDDFVWAAQAATTLDPARVRASSERYLMENVRWDYQAWFDDLYSVYESAHDKNKLGWHRIRETPPDWREHITW